MKFKEQSSKTNFQGASNPDEDPKMKLQYYFSQADLETLLLTHLKSNKILTLFSD